MLGGEDGQDGRGEHGQGDVAVPAGPAADLVVELISRRAATVRLPLGGGDPLGDLVNPDEGAAVVDVHASVAADGQDVADSALLEVIAHSGVGAVDLITGHPT
ncbi:hypothetical protein [Micromonospora sp. KC606]|uniref:hypothetical protein n=1 Tax=Micromonospora sp. KC606 TaxID=2530379 RepID=UPI001FB84018|nr:hypothetical protein [Micromonospora sp. KC606]